MRRVIFLLAAVIGLPALSHAQEHKFWDARAKRDFAITAGIRAVDIGQTCYFMKTREDWHENQLPVKRCGTIAAYIAGEQGVQVGVQYLLHRSGHHRLERWLPYVQTAPNAVAIVVSLRNARRH